MRGELELYLVSKMQCMGSPRYCLAAERTERLVSIKTVTLDWRMAWEMERRIFIIKLGIDINNEFLKRFALGQWQSFRYGMLGVEDGELFAI